MSLIENMHMNRERSNDRIESLLKVHIEALDGDPNAKRVVEALKNVKSDLHGLVQEIFDELDAIAEQDETDAQAEAVEREAMQDGA